MPGAEVLFCGVQIRPLSFHTIISSLAYLSRPLQSRRTSTHTDSDQYSFQTLVWLSLPRSEGPPRSPRCPQGLCD